MPKKVCRLRWRKGEPLRLSIYPAITFLDLTREIRDCIYHEALVASRPIIVWQANHNAHIFDSMGKRITADGKDSILDDFGYHLLYCSRMIGREAAEVFYGRNIFHLNSYEVWNHLCRFLTSIGVENRENMRSLLMNIQKTKVFSQDLFGTRILMPSSIPGVTVHSSGSLLEEFSQVPVHTYIEPDIEAYFRTVGHLGPSVSLILRASQGVFSGLEFPDNGPWGSINDLSEKMKKNAYYFLTKDLTDQVERSRQQFASRVEVIWEGRADEQKFETRKHILEFFNWEILEEEEKRIMPRTILRPNWVPPTHQPQTSPRRLQSQRHLNFQPIRPTQNPPPPPRPPLFWAREALPRIRFIMRIKPGPSFSSTFNHTQ